MLFTYCVFVLSCFLSITNGARILAIVGTPSYSHQIAYRPIWRELARRGHEIVLLTSHPMNDPSLVTLKEIDLSFTIKYVDEEYNMDEKLQNATENWLQFVKDIFMVRINTNKKILEHPEVKALIDDRSIDFDVMMLEFNVQDLMGFSHIYNIPIIFMTSFGSMSYFDAFVGNQYNPILYPDPFWSYRSPDTFFKKIHNILSYIFVLTFRTYFLIPLENESLKLHFGEDCPTVKELERNIHMIFTYQNIATDSAKTSVPAMVALGGLHINEPKSLPKDLEEYMNNSKNGIIYFSLGSSVKSKDISNDTRKALIETFKELPYDVLWKFELPTLEGKPDNVKIIKWAPQQDILRHPKVKLFITQGGLQSVEEAIYTHNAMLVLPVAGDQDYNGDGVVEKGYGLKLGIKSLEKISFKAAIMELINNPKYKEAVKKMAEISLDQPMTSLEKAVWWTEYVIRHKGAKHLKGPAVNIPIYQYLLLDVIGFCLAILIMASYTIYVTLRYFKNIIFRHDTVRSLKTKIK